MGHSSKCPLPSSASSGSCFFFLLCTWGLFSSSQEHLRSARGLTLLKDNPQAMREGTRGINILSFPSFHLASQERGTGCVWVRGRIRAWDLHRASPQAQQEALPRCCKKLWNANRLKDTGPGGSRHSPEMTPLLPWVMSSISVSRSDGWET